MIKNLTFVMLVVLSVSCSNKTNTSTTKETSNTAAVESKGLIDFQKQGYISAVVIDMTALDGCQFLLKLESGKKLEPDKLDQSYRQNDLKVWIKYSFLKGGASICMSGQMVTLLDIQRR